MARKTAVSVENLEARSLLSGIAYSLTTDHSVYQVGQPIQITFTETNTGTAAGDGLAQPDRFLRLRERQLGLGVEPGERRSAPDLGDAPTGSVRVPDGHLGRHGHRDRLPASSTTTSYAVNQFGTLQVSNPNAPPGDTATFQITNPLQGTLTTVRQSTSWANRSCSLTPRRTPPTRRSRSRPRILLFQVLHDGQPVSARNGPARPRPLRRSARGKRSQHQFTLSRRSWCLCTRCKT